MRNLLEAFSLEDGTGSAELLKSLLDASEECLRILDLDGRVRFINRAGLEQVEVDDFSVLKGVVWRDQWPEGSRSQLDDALESARNGRPQAFRGLCYTRRGAARWWDTVVSPMRRNDGEIAWLLAVSRDVTVSAEAQTFYDTLVHLLPNPLLVKDASDGRYVLINDAAEKAFGLDREKALGRTAADLIGHDHGARLDQEAQRAIDTREVLISEDQPVETPEGLRYFSNKTRATFDGDRPRHIVKLCEDVTTQRSAIEKLRQALDAAETANAAKSAFLANMSHEIRTPMNGIVAGADMLARRRLDRECRELVEIIGDSARTLEGLLSDVLDIARIEAGQMRLELAPFQLGELVRSAAALARLRAVDKGVEVVVSVSEDADGSVLGDPGRVRQVLMNLLSNAVKFTEHGEIRVSAERLADGAFRMAVSDTGIGFDSAFRERLFDRFQQADGSITRRFGGTGLGMAISRDLVELMGGRLDCESRPGRGSRFWFDLPLDPAEASQPDAAYVEAPEGPAELKILAADDHPTNRKILELMLAGLAEVTAVENGAEALAIFRAGGFDLVLMDMQMPVLDGLAAVRRIREIERERVSPPTPIIMLTANALPEHAAASLEAGADRHLQKPFTLASLMGAITELIGKAESEAPAAQAVG